MTRPKLIRNAHEAARKAYEVEYVPEGDKRPSPVDLIIQDLLLNRGKAFVLMAKTSRKTNSAYAFVRRLRRRAEEGGVGLLVEIRAVTYFKEGLVRVYGRALTEEEHKQVVAALDGQVQEQPSKEVARILKLMMRNKQLAVVKGRNNERKQRGSEVAGEDGREDGEEEG